jgi:hypothetical protein
MPSSEMILTPSVCPVVNRRRPKAEDNTFSSPRLTSGGQKASSSFNPKLLLNIHESICISMDPSRRGSKSLTTLSSSLNPFTVAVSHSEENARLKQVGIPTAKGSRGTISLRGEGAKPPARMNKHRHGKRSQLL